MQKACLKVQIECLGCPMEEKEQPKKRKKEDKMLS